MPDEPAQALSDHSAVPVQRWTIRPGTMARGWHAVIDGPLSVLDLEVVPALTLWHAYCATCDGIPLPFGSWMMHDGPSDVVREVQELRDAYDTVSEQEFERTSRCQHCPKPTPADERSFMCSDCASKADEEAQNLRDENEALKAAAIGTGACGEFYCKLCNSPGWNRREDVIHDAACPMPPPDRHGSVETDEQEASDGR